MGTDDHVFHLQQDFQPLDGNVSMISLLMLPGILLVTLSSPLFVSPRAPLTTNIDDIVSIFVQHSLLISISRSLHFDNFSVNFVEVFLSL